MVLFNVRARDNMRWERYERRSETDGKRERGREKAQRTSTPAPDNKYEYRKHNLRRCFQLPKQFDDCRCHHHVSMSVCYSTRYVYERGRCEWFVCQQRVQHQPHTHTHTERVREKREWRAATPTRIEQSFCVYSHLASSDAVCQSETGEIASVKQKSEWIGMRANETNMRKRQSARLGGLVVSVNAYRLDVKS